MQDLEITIKGPPVSQQTKRRSRLQEWKADVAEAALSQIPHEFTITDEEVSVTITYFYEDESPDVDNIIKPIQDALKGIVYYDDEQVVDTKARKRKIDGSYTIRGVSSKILQAFSIGDNFLHIKVEDAPDQTDLY